MSNLWHDNCFFLWRPGFNRPYTTEMDEVSHFENLFITHRAPAPFWQRVRETLRLIWYFWKNPLNTAYLFPEPPKPSFVVRYETPNKLTIETDKKKFN